MQRCSMHGGVLGTPVLCAGLTGNLIREDGVEDFPLFDLFFLAHDCVGFYRYWQGEGTCLTTMAKTVLGVLGLPASKSFRAWGLPSAEWSHHLPKGPRAGLSAETQRRPPGRIFHFSRGPIEILGCACKPIAGPSCDSAPSTEERNQRTNSQRDNHVYRALFLTVVLHIPNQPQWLGTRP